MISIFHPSLIFCTQTNWSNPNFRGTFINNLFSHLDQIENLKIKVAWSNEFFNYFWQNSPWTDSYYENYIVEIIYPKLNNLFEFISSPCNIECEMDTNILNDFSEEIQREWLIIIHRLLHIQTKTFVVIGLDLNVQNNSITVFCNCDGYMEECFSIINDPSDWYIKVDYMEKCPCELDGWDDNFKIAVQLCREQEYNFRDFKTKLEDINFSNNFKGNFLDLDESKRKRIIKSITKLLTFTHPEAGRDGGLQEEVINGRFRIRISQGERVHYEENEGKKLFLDYTPSSRHDAPL